jgi:hypothetical protein
MKPSEKRTTTEPGLGKVSAETRRTTMRDRVGDAAPPSGGRASGPPAARLTRAIESSRPHEKKSVERPAADEASSDTPAPASERAPLSSPIDRSERDDARADHPSGERTPIDVTHVDTKRLPRPAGAGASASGGGAGERFEAKEHPTGRRPIESRRPSRLPPGDVKPGSRTVDGKPVSNRPGDGARGRPASHRPASAGAGEKTPGKRRGNSLPPPSTSATARSKRVSLREISVGDAVNRLPESAGAGGSSSRSVPRLLKSKAEIAAAPIDHRAGFLLAHIDGTTSVQGLVDIAGMAENEVHEILERLRRLGIVAIR